jgi:hypothetical protein
MNKNHSQVDQTVMFATAFYYSAGKAPNAWTLSENSKLAMYYRCMVVCYASLRRLYPEATLVLFSNRELPEPFNAQLKSLEVATELCGNHYVGDSNFSNGFPGCLFTLDVIETLANKPPPNIKALVLIDSDCVARLRMDPMLADLAGKGKNIYAYPPGYPVTMLANGQSRASLTLALSYLSNRLIANPIPLYGGEFLGIAIKELPHVAKNIETFWTWMKAQGTEIFGRELTEEHVLSVALADPEMLVRSDAQLVKRIWTADVFSTVDGSENGIAIWHLPAEKKKGFSRLYQYCQRHGGFSHLEDTEFLALVDKLIPLQHRNQNYPGKKLILRLRNTARTLVTGRA